MRVDVVRNAYGLRVDEYVGVCGRIEHTVEPDRDFVLTWAKGVAGLVLDVGCGPGQWTQYLAGHGIDVEGIDPVPAFVEHARTTYPAARYRVGRAEALGVEDSSVDGVLAWYSLIHTDPDEIDAPLTAFARAIAPGGGLALGFFTGPRLETFAHAVTPGYTWPVDLLAAQVVAAGFIVTHSGARHDPGARPHGEVLATRCND